MKKIIFTLLILVPLAFSTFTYFEISKNNNLIDSKIKIIDSLNINLTILRSSVHKVSIINDSLYSKINSLENEKEKIKKEYWDKQKFVEQMNKNFMKSIDQNGDGNPDNVEIGDFNGNGIPDAAER